MKYIQSFFESAGKYACYALCIIEIATRVLNKKLDEVKSLQFGIEQEFIFFDKHDFANEKNFFVKEPGKYLSALTGRRFDVRKEKADYIPRKGEWVVNLYAADSQYDKNDIIDDDDPRHFALDDFNSLQKSRCVTEGKIIGKRVFYEV